MVIDMKEINEPLEKIKKTIKPDDKAALFLMGILEEISFKMEEGYYHMRDKLAEFDEFKKES